MEQGLPHDARAAADARVDAAFIIAIVSAIALLSLGLLGADRELETEARESLERQREIEAADARSFEAHLAAYFHGA